MTRGQTSSIHLGLLLHNHQPVGNFPWVFQQVYEEAYLPLLEALERHPKVRLSLHYTGSLLDWIEEAHPEFFDRLAELVQRNQVEIVSGGYYEPILPAIPDADKVAQIRRLTSSLSQRFGRKPTGMWIAERVWEPSLPHVLRQVDIEWTILDDIHFKSAGLEDADLYGYYATEDLSTVLKIYATSQVLRYTIPWRPAWETIETLRTLATPNGRRILVMGDDGEKFGSWPGTREYCWGDKIRTGWVEEFFTALEENSDWLHTTPLGEYAANYPALGRIYIPTSSYIEMTEWVLPARKSYTFGKILHQLEEERRDDVRQFMRGGFWRNFLVKYPEANNQHKKMLRVHDIVYAAPDGPDEAALVQLWKAQANDTYWHGLFGGVYMGHVRSAIYHHLIKAENIAERRQFGTNSWQRYEFTDFDRDSQDELIIEGDQQNLYIDPQRGGTIFEWDMRRSMHNLVSVMTRREEGYHQTLREYEQERRRREAALAKAAQRESSPESTSAEPASPHTTVRTKEPNLDAYLVVDPYRRNSLIDHFLAPSVTLAHFAQQLFEEQGNFVEFPYQSEAQQDEQGITMMLYRDGYVRRAGALSSIPVRVSKRLFLPRGEERLVIRYTIENKGQTRLLTQFASEWNINLLGGGNNDQAYYRIEGDGDENAVSQSSTEGAKELKRAAQAQMRAPTEGVIQDYFDSTGEVFQVRGFSIGNRWLKQDVAFRLSEAATLWRFSIETVTGSEAGFERNHQGSCLTLVWPLELEAEQSWSVGIECVGSPASIGL